MTPTRLVLILDGNRGTEREWRANPTGLRHSRCKRICCNCFLLLLFSLLPARLWAVPGDESWDDRFGPAGIINGNVNAIPINGTDVYAGGNFTQAGASNILNLAHWNG